MLKGFCHASTHTYYTFLQVESVVSMNSMYLNYVPLCRTQGKKVVKSSCLLKVYLGTLLQDPSDYSSPSVVC